MKFYNSRYYIANFHCALYRCIMWTWYNHLEIKHLVHTTSTILNFLLLIYEIKLTSFQLEVPFPEAHPRQLPGTHFDQRGEGTQSQSPGSKPFIWYLLAEFLCEVAQFCPV